MIHNAIDGNLLPLWDTSTRVGGVENFTRTQDVRALGCGHGAIRPLNITCPHHPQTVIPQGAGHHCRHRDLQSDGWPLTVCRVGIMLSSLRAARLVWLAIGGLLVTATSASSAWKTSLTRSSTISEVLNTIPECAVGHFVHRPLENKNKNEERRNGT